MQGERAPAAAPPHAQLLDAHPPSLVLLFLDKVHARTTFFCRVHCVDYVLDNSDSSPVFGPAPTCVKVSQTADVRSSSIGEQSQSVESKCCFANPGMAKCDM
eukprot:scaffold558_cov111-Cylindrotheca_fusiformis.AAC.10